MKRKAQRERKPKTWERRINGRGHRRFLLRERTLVRGANNDARRACGPILALAIAAAAVVAWAGPGRGEDVVRVANPSSAQGYAEWRGRVVDYTGRELQLELSGGVKRTFPADQVVEVETPRGPQHVEADRRLAAADFEGALTLYDEARAAETRAWVRRRIVAQIVRCYRALGQWEPAGKWFLEVLLPADSHTPDFACIPLAWVPGQPTFSLERTATEWLRRDESPAAVLLGASHLMSTALRTEALERLNRLATDADPPIAQLAQAQTWRAAAVTADARRVAAWRDTLDQMPEALRAGPYYVMGLAEAHHQRWEAAALAWLRVPILYPEDRLLSARSLLDAGRALERLDRPQQAMRLYRELLEKYPKSPAESEARSLLEELKRRG